MVRALMISVFILIVAGCKSYQSGTIPSESFTDENLLDSLVAKWQSSNVKYLEGLKEFAQEDNEKRHIENMLVYSARSSKGSGQYEARRKSFLRFLFSNYNIETKDFIVLENFQGEKVFYSVLFEDKKITFQNLVENWNETKTESVMGFENLAKNIRVFERDSSCSLRSFSFSLITFFEKEGAITKLDDKSCQTGDILK